jgi:hypothetical protein
MHVRSIDDHFPEFLYVPRRDWHFVRELLGKHLWEADLVDADVWVGGDDGARGVVHPLAHHVHAEDALLSLDQLLEAPADLDR